MNLPPLDQLKHLQAEATPGPWTAEEDHWEEVIVANDVGHRMEWGEQVRFVFEAGNPKADPQLVALAPDLLAEVIRMKEELTHYVSVLEAAGEEDAMRHPPEKRRVFRAVAKILTRILNGETNV